MKEDRRAAELIREIRARSGMTQARLATRAGIPRPVLSAYQNGRRQPSVAILSRLAGAGGLRLQVATQVDPARNAARFVDALSIVDAMPQRRKRRDPLARPVAWENRENWEK